MRTICLVLRLRRPYHPSTGFVRIGTPGSATVTTGGRDAVPVLSFGATRGFKIDCLVDQLVHLDVNGNDSNEY